MNDNSELEALMRRGLLDSLYWPLFCRALVGADVLVLIPRVSPSRFGPRQVDTLPFLFWSRGEERIVPFFSSLAMLRRVNPAGTDWIMVPARRLVSVALTAEVLLHFNPESEFNHLFGVEDVTRLHATAVNMAIPPAAAIG